MLKNALTLKNVQTCRYSFFKILNNMPLSLEKQRQADTIYLLLAALFVAALVSCNLIANKFLTVDLGFKTFVLSAGVLPYPITFLITDILSEIYGRKKTNRVIIAGFFASLFVLFILKLGAAFPAIADSPVSDGLYNITFNNAWKIIMASMFAYITAQLVDVRLFHFWKNLTNGKMLWLRNNASTVFSQLVDTALVVTIIFIGTKTFSEITPMIFDGWLFKSLVALLDTPFLYAATWLFRRHFGLAFGEELKE